MELELAYRPTGKQLAFHASTADEVLYGGAAGGGSITASGFRSDANSNTTAAMTAPASASSRIGHSRVMKQSNMTTPSRVSASYAICRFLLLSILWIFSFLVN